MSKVEERPRLFFSGGERVLPRSASGASHEGKQGVPIRGGQVGIGLLKFGVHLKAGVEALNPQREGPRRVSQRHPAG